MLSQTHHSQQTTREKCRFFGSDGVVDGRRRLNLCFEVPIQGRLDWCNLLNLKS